MNGMSTQELKEFGQYEAARFLKEVEEANNEDIGTDSKAGAAGQL